MKKILAALLIVVSAFASAEIVTIPIPGAPGLNITVGTGVNALPLQEIKNNPNAVNITTYDDSYTNVPLGFNFPMYGQTFSNSWAATNGFVAFRDPVTTGLYGGCCQGVNLSTKPGSAYNYTIYGLHTDLYSPGTNNQYYLRENNSMTYGWYGVSQCCSSQGGNSFEIKIDSSGLIDTRIAGAMVSYNSVTSGFAGDLSKGEYYQYYHGQGMNISSGAGVSWGAFNGTGTGADLCTINPLSSATCTGYQAAYTTQQCTVSSLWDPSCPGYQVAYFIQQCTLDPLYNSQCPGYQTAYLTQQCSANPLYSTTCSGYEQAYHDRQCSLNTLSYTDCPGYAAAYLTQQCNANPLYSTTCSGYEQANLNAQCILDSLYSNKCEGYATAYAIKYLITGIDSTAVNSSLSSTAATKASDPATKVVSTSSASTTVGTDGTISTGVSATGNATVDSAIAPKTTSTAPTNPSAPVNLTQAPSPSPSGSAPAQNDRGGNNKQEQRDGSSGPQSNQQAQGNGPQEQKSDQPKTARQELQERRQEAAKTQAVEKGKNLANEMGKAVNMENQVAVQNVVIQAMGYSPAFEAYKVAMPDVVGYKPYSIYKNQTTVDNRRLGRGLFGATDNLHNSMVEQQYK